MTGRARTRALVLFARDLRLTDHAVLVEAARFGEIVPVLVLDGRLRSRLALSPRRAAYFAAAVRALDAALRLRGSRLVVRDGDVATHALAIARATDAGTVLFGHAYDRAGARDRDDLQAILEEAGLRAYGVHDAPAVPPEETSALRHGGDGAGYRAFRPYLATWRGVARPPLRASLHFAALPPDLASEPLPRGGALCGAELPEPEGVSEEAATAAFGRFLTGAALQYNVASRVPGGEPTARLSAALSFGIVSARSLLAAIDARLAEAFLLAEERVALVALQTSLAERDFFLQLAHFFEGAPDAALRAARESVFARDHPLLATWLEGRTGYPLVDAGILQLHATGWMHPHVRRVAASFLCFDLGVDWRVGRDAWDRHLEEDDAALATGNWQWSAGVGADLAAVPRIFNPRKQLRRYDPALAYVRRFVPALATVPASEIFGETTEPRPQLALPLFGERAYPAPVLDHEAAARAFLARYGALAS